MARKRARDIAVQQKHPEKYRLEEREIEEHDIEELDIEEPDIEEPDIEERDIGEWDIAFDSQQSLTSGGMAEVLPQQWDDGVRAPA